MAHEVETMAYAGETPWHGLGVSVGDDLTPHEMLIKAGLDWSVYKLPAYCRAPIDEDKHELLQLDTCALLRSSDNAILDEVSSDWEPVQNEEAFAFFHEFVASGDMKMHTAGSLSGGRRVWALAKINESFTVFKQDQIDSYLLFSNPHLYGKSIDIRFTPIRVVCNNTLTLSLGRKGDLSVRLNHRNKFDAEMAKDALGIAHTKLSDYKQMAEFLGSRRAMQDDVVSYFKQVFPITGKAANDENGISRAAAKALEALEAQPGAKLAEGSWWQPYNAVTFLIDHRLGHNQDSRLNSAWYGAGRDRKTAALELAVDMAKAA